MAIRAVLFDALFTIVAPRQPIYVQYSQTFEPYLGVLDPDMLKKSFKSALRQVQKEKPAYESGAEGWWGEVIKRTALGAGADPRAVERSLDEIAPWLLHRFSSREGYKLFDDSIPTLQRLRSANIRTGLISNTDARMRAVLDDLDATRHLDTILLSSEEGIEKPAREMFLRACARLGIQPSEAVHVGDELPADYYGAKESGLEALLVRRPGPEGEGEAKEPDEDLTGVTVVPSLAKVVDWVQRRNTVL
ncbi:HAD-superfamily hydrolase [Daedalea quercina L-15889]|uniref:HAD-superfamily hydrolase n=1 Tax=Daedalea quercina L-15889 TaxID=1314783 RepID=A0A165MP74_9APHY|nr:HAD-superfamily hydrolase [Daedalea quercina L-15889]